MINLGYAATVDYKTTFGGSLIPDAELDAYLQKASDTVDRLTYSKIVARGWDNLTLLQQNSVKTAICYQAEHLYSYGDISPNLASYSVGGNSVNLGNNVDMRYSPQAKEYLKSTGLMYRGL